MGLMPRRRVARLMMLVPLLLLAVSALPEVARTSGPTPADLDRACGEGEPFLVTTSFRGMTREQGAQPFDLDAPSVVVFSDTASNRPQYRLATLEQVGAVWGLAYRRADHSVYAAAYHKVQLPFGPGGPGGVYRIDLASGDVSHALTVPDTGADMHRMNARFDEDAESGVGRTSLGDIDVSADGATLFAVNLDNRRVYRFALPSGQLIDSFAHGAAGEPWAASARPFGISVHEGHVFHGVVNSAEASLKRTDLAAHVYRSRPDGSDMTQVLTFPLDFNRGRAQPANLIGSFWTVQARQYDLDWEPWRDNYRPGLERYDNVSAYPMPMLTDITFDASGHMVVGFRDRRSDSLPHFRTSFGMQPEHDSIVGFGIGDLLRAEWIGGAWSQDVLPEHFADRVAQFGDEVAMGGLAQIADANLTVTSAYVTERTATAQGAYWFDSAIGRVRGREQIHDALRMEPLRALAPRVAPVYADNEGPREWEVRGPGTLGDVEALCGPAVEPSPTPTETVVPTPTPTSAPTVTRVPPSPSPTVRPTDTPAPSATPAPGPIFLPLALREHCDPEHKRADVALVTDTSGSMAGQKLANAKAAALAFVAMTDLTPGRDQVAVVRFDSEADVVQPLTRDRARIEAAIQALESRQGTHVDKGLVAARRELGGDRHAPDNLSVIVLLTDGIHNGEPGADVRAAEEARAAGIRVYTIGLGADVDAAALEAMAGTASRYYFAPDSEDLERIYGEIARDIMCPPSQFWGQR